MIIGLNKIDVVRSGDDLMELERRARRLSKYVVKLSAKEGLNVEELIETLKRALGRTERIEISLPYDSYSFKLLDFIKRRGEIIEVCYSKEGMLLKRSQRK